MLPFHNANLKKKGHWAADPVYIFCNLQDGLQKENVIAPQTCCFLRFASL